MNGLTHVLAVALIVTQLSGCSLIDLLFDFDEPVEPGEPFPAPTTEARYTTGSATLTIDGETILLDELVGEAVVDGFMGLSVRWTNGDGWFLGVSSIADMGPVAESTFLAIDWLADNRHWTIFDPSRCDTTIERERVGPRRLRDLHRPRVARLLQQLLVHGVPGAHPGRGAVRCGDHLRGALRTRSSHRPAAGAAGHSWTSAHPGHGSQEDRRQPDVEALLRPRPTLGIGPQLKLGGPGTPSDLTTVPWACK